MSVLSLAERICYLCIKEFREGGGKNMNRFIQSGNKCHCVAGVLVDVVDENYRTRIRRGEGGGVLEQVRT